MRKRPADPLALAVYGEERSLPRQERWRRWKRTGLPIVAAVAIVVASAVIIDLPSPPSLAGERSAATSVIGEVNSDVTPCAFGVGEAATLWRDVRRGSLSAAERAKVPGLLQDDADACSFTSGNINDLSDIDEPGTGIGKYLAQVVAVAETWTTSDALGAIDDVIDLTSAPSPAGARSATRDLVTRNGYLSADRRAARAALADASNAVHGGIPTLAIPVVRFST